MAFIGTYQQGDLIPLRVQCLDNSGVPTVPDAVPVARLFNPKGQLSTNSAPYAQLPPLDRYGTTGLFGTTVPVSVALGLQGLWSVVYLYIIGSYKGVSQDSFYVTLGGDDRGNVISMAYYLRPESDIIVAQTDGAIGAGQVGLSEIRYGKNPRI